MAETHMWRVQLEEYSYKIYDPDKRVAGYFDPDYGRMDPAEELERIQKMLKNSDSITRGFLTLPMVRFGIFSEDSMSVDVLSDKVEEAFARITHWKKFMASLNNTHAVSVSHTDQDMLSMTLEIKFGERVPLDHAQIQGRLEPILDEMHKLGLL